MRSCDLREEDQQGVQNNRKRFLAKKSLMLFWDFLVLQRLSLQAMNPLQEKILGEMADREVTAEIIREWVLAHEDKEDDEEDEPRKPSGMSDTAYFHSLGKET
jgi:hypothetical protein